jgi:hypothetical protein
MAINCGQTVIPTTDETPLPCNDFRSTRCTLHEPAIAYLGLAINTPLEEVLDAYLTSLTDARNRIAILEAQPAKVLKVDTSTAYEFVAADAENMISFNNVGPITVTVPDDATLAFVVGTKIEIFNLGVGVVSIVGAGVTFIENIGTTVPQGGSRTLVKVAANTWVIKY